ncbi:MAG: hypothetical protein Q8S13_09315 [Dehalococcoidia bacterium]|nr:hypothetical protein [Dehalococcoidia bacterium]
MSKSALTLLEKAKNERMIRGSIRKLGHEEIELALAWARDEVTLRQVNAVIGGDPSGSTSAYLFLARALREAIRRKEVQV